MNAVTESKQAPIAGAFESLKRGDLEGAREVFAGLMHDAQYGVDAHRGLASIAWRQGKPETALQLLNMAMRVDPAHLDLRADLALVLLTSGRAKESLEHWEFRLKLRPNEGPAWHNYARALASAGDAKGAVQAFERAVQAWPENQPTYEAYARALVELGDEAEAEAVWRRALERFPTSDSAFLGLAELLFKQARLNECIALYRKGLGVVPDSPELHLGLGQLAEDLGDRVEAEAEFRKALELRPGWALPVEALLTLLRGKARDEDIAAAQAILADEQRPPQDHANTGYGLGKALEGRNDYEGAFAAWEKANVARRAQIGQFDRAKGKDRVDRLIQQFSAEFLTRRKGWGSDSRRPVFVLGMPRSGTTLVEQILASHPKVDGCGEVTDLARVAQALEKRAGSIHRWPEAAGSLDEVAVREGAEDYLAGVLRHRPSDAERLVDKAPNNFFHIGLIALMFPNAAVIWCRRDPRDVCTSIYSENFGLNQKHATDLSDIGFFYREHLRLMHHWQAVAGRQITECRYEDLISDPEAMTRRLLDAIGLEWDARCLKFHEDRRPVLTPSRWQVRSPIYRSAAGRWKRYERHLGPLITSLGDALDG